MTPAVLGDFTLQAFLDAEQLAPPASVREAAAARA
jgi:hypothetical protein